MSIRYLPVLERFRSWIWNLALTWFLEGLIFESYTRKEICVSEYVLYCIVSLSFYWSILQDPTTLLFVVILLPYNYFTTRSRGSSRGLPSVPLPNSLTRLGLTRAKVSHSGDRTVTSSSELGLNPGPPFWATSLDSY